MDTSRLFFALWPDAAVRDKVAKLIQQCQQDHGGRAVTKESLHMTLAFLGETPNSRLSDVQAVGSSIMTSSFNLTLNCAGCWSGGIFWLAPEESPPALTALATALHEKLKAASISFDSKRFVPHMTILRRAGFRGHEISVEPIELAMRDFVLMRTLPAPKGVTHEVIGRFPLRT